MDEGYRNPVMYLNWTPHDDPGQLISLVKNQFYITQKAVESTSMRIVAGLLPPEEVGNPGNVKARRLAAMSMLPYASISGTLTAKRTRDVRYILGPKSPMERLVCTEREVAGVLDGELPGGGTGGGTGAEGVTIGMTTCKRLAEFVVTVEALLPAIGYFVASDGRVCSASDTTEPVPVTTDISVHRPRPCAVNATFMLYSYVHEVVVVDDLSSAADRMAMLQLYPMLAFIMKPARQRGHARSLNILLNRVHTR